MRIGEALTFVFEDERWPGKVGLGALIMLVPVLNFAAVGYEAQVARRIADRQSSLLPDWGDLADLFREGTGLALARYVYAFPALILSMIPVLAFLALMVVSATQGRLEERLPAALGLCFGGFGLILLIGALIGSLSMAVTARYVRRPRFDTCFQLGSILDFIGAQPAAYLAAWGTILGLSLAFSLIVMPFGALISLIPCVGSIAYLALLSLGLFFLILATGHLEGQLLRSFERPAEAPSPAA